MAQNVFQANLVSMGMNLVFAIVAMCVGLLALKLIDKYLFPEINFVEEIKKGNMAAAIAAGMGIFFMAMVLSNAVR